MTPAREAEIRAAVEKATPGEWQRDGSTVFALEHHGWKRGQEQMRNRITASVQPGPATPAAEVEADATFIALARSAVPELLSELDRLRTEAADLWSSGHGGSACADDGERDGQCVCCGKVNPYRSGP